ncbi:subtilisin-like protein [Lentithecium fluviatile CBS 122367]|uniref:Subtilisin-like protein n=1 Tax=Lentithecium fluviatile CBS 122367 TaxID=1168545 RepID=A0A6G1IVS6_9PLEO|nr:subtilisin-like protein [Lentithecium fluviatile CBS 122367]
MRTTFAYAALAASFSAAYAADVQTEETGEEMIGAIPSSVCKFDKGSAVEVTVMVKSGTSDDVEDSDSFLQKVGMSLDLDQKFEWLNNSAFKAINMETTKGCADALAKLSFVDLVEETAEVKSFVTQTTAPWGLQRISNDAGASGDPKGQDFTYTFDDETLGQGVDIYVIDTGVRDTHAAFQGRASQGFTAFSSSTDGDGHGTHVAGTAASARFGVAQRANIFAVKVLGDDGSGSSSDTIAGMNWVINNHAERKTQDGFVGSIMSMSWGLAGTATAVDKVIQAASDAGIHVSVAAGNDGADACGTTPAHLGGANSNVVTVGSVNIENTVSTFSNIGQCVDIYAPGEQILSTWNTGDNVINFLSGTSMATPANTGVMAYLMAQDPTGLGQNPAALKAKLLETARQDAISGDLGGSANLLLSNGVDGNVAAKKKRTVTGSPAAWAKSLVHSHDKRWELFSSDSPMRF